MFKHMWKETNLFFLQMVDVFHCWVCTDASEITLGINFPHSAEKHFLWFTLIFYQFVICEPEVFLCNLLSVQNQEKYPVFQGNDKSEVKADLSESCWNQGSQKGFLHWLFQIKLKHSLCWMLQKEWSVLLIAVNRWENKHIATWAVAVLESGACRMHCHSWAALIRFAKVAVGRRCCSTNRQSALGLGLFFSSQPMPLYLHQDGYQLLKHCWVS